MVPEYRSTNVYTRSFIRHRTVQCKVNVAVDASESGATSRVATLSILDKLVMYYFKLLRVTSCTYVSAINASIVSSVFVVCNRPSQDHRILRMQTVQINLQLYPAYLLWNRRKTLTGSPDPTYMQPTNNPCNVP